jgi:hypothetical protein
MINTTDFQELETTLPGDWLRKDNGDVYSFTTDKMELRDERLFRELKIRHKDGSLLSAQYALTIEDDYCGILLDTDEFIVLRLDKHLDGSIQMEWQDRENGITEFEKRANG